MKINKKRQTKNKIILLITGAVLVAGGLFFAYYYLNVSQKPVSQETATENQPAYQGLPTIKDSDSDGTASHETPTKVENKTPAQYEEQKVDDPPAYDNEQFRIPEENAE